MDTLIPFFPFNEFGEVRIYQHGDLPHWRQDGCTYFVTFRLADSLPQSVLVELQEERESWLRCRGIDPGLETWRESLARLPKSEQREFEKQVGDRLNKALDLGAGSCVLREPSISGLVADALSFYHGTRVWTGDYVVMPNHVHVLLTPMSGYELEEILQAVKSYTSKRINERTGNEGPLWQRESYDHIVRDAGQLGAFQKYIRNNPTKAGLRDGDFRMSGEVCYEIVR